MNKEILKTILKDIETLNINKELDNNKYYYNLIIGNLKDLTKPTIKVNRQKFLDRYFENNEENYNIDIYEILLGSAEYRLNIKDIYNQLGYMPINLIQNIEVVKNETMANKEEIQEPYNFYDIEFNNK